jgi:hypothetical protein
MAKHDGSSFFRSAPDANPDTFSDEFNRLARPNCSECGSTAIRWMSAGELLVAVPEEQKARVREGIEFLGSGGRAWLCPDCGGFGIMGDFM